MVGHGGRTVGDPRNWLSRRLDDVAHSSHVPDLSEPVEVVGDAVHDGLAFGLHGILDWLAAQD